MGNIGLKAQMNAMMAYRYKQFVGYGVKTSGGWTCVLSMGMTWTTNNCRTMDEARNCLKLTTHATDVKLIGDVQELEKAIQKLPEHLMPSIMPEAIAEQGGFLPKIAPAQVFVWQKK